MKTLKTNVKIKLKKKLMIKPKNSGFTLIELLITLSILGILTFLVTPKFTEILQQKDLTTAKNKIIHSLQKAKKIANAENTFVDVNISDNMIHLSPTNNSQALTIKLPGRIAIDSDVSFTFKSTGIIYKEGDQSAEEITNIKINPTNNSSLFETITVSNNGIIASLD